MNFKAGNNMLENVKSIYIQRKSFTLFEGGEILKLSFLPYSGYR
jgi:hypothetical protein